MEGRHEKEARAQIRSEKGRDKVKHDRMLDRARIRDTREKNATPSMREDTNADIERLLDRITHKNKYKKAIRFYLDYRKKRPGKAMYNAVQAAKITGTDYRNLEKVFHELIRQGKLPKHLAFNDRLLDKKTVKQKVTDFFKKKGDK